MEIIKLENIGKSFAEVVTGLAKDNAIKDFSYKEPDIESLIKNFYTAKRGG